MNSLKNLVTAILIGCFACTFGSAWAAPTPQATDEYLKDLQGSLGTITHAQLKSAPAKITIGDCCFTLKAGLSANLMPTIGPNHRGLRISLMVSETGRKHLPQGAKLSHLWLVRKPGMCEPPTWYRDLRTVPEQPMTCRWYTFEKNVDDGPLGFARSDTLKVVVGITTADGQVLLLGTTAKVSKVY